MDCHSEPSIITKALKRGKKESQSEEEITWQCERGAESVGGEATLPTVKLEEGL